MNRIKTAPLSEYLEALRVQRWDDHRYYHHSRINQSLHLVSAVSFVVAYGFLVVDPAIAALIAWCISMTSRQSGHFFFEPKGYDHVNRATHEHKEDIKVGYNLRRKVVLMALWAAAPAVLWFSPDFLGLLDRETVDSGFVRSLGMVWFVIGAGGLVFRTVHLFFLRDVTTGLVWAVKIITDPFHDILLYWRSPLALLRGELIDPMDHALDDGLDGPVDQPGATR
ncbi:MAG: hypothetical protein LW626_12670 [Verrucomicrobium sp.]|nr:hypothetical protein [Verrucomicrobium sp.]